jgi:hypothetical protein
MSGSASPPKPLATEAGREPQPVRARPRQTQRGDRAVELRGGVVLLLVLEIVEDGDVAVVEVEGAQVDRRTPHPGDGQRDHTAAVLALVSHDQQVDLVERLQDPRQVRLRAQQLGGARRYRDGPTGRHRPGPPGGVGE